MNRMESDPRDAVEADELEEYVTDEEIGAILREYHRRRLLSDLMGPCTSLATHVVILSVLFLVVIRPAKEETKLPEAQIVIEPVTSPPVKPPPPPEVETTSEDLPDVVVPDPAQVATKAAESVQESVDAEELADEPETADKMAMAEVCPVALTNSPFILENWSRPGGMKNRGPGSIEDVIRAPEFEPPTISSTNRALEWLKRVQNEDGSWGTKDQPARTGMALLVFLGRGETVLSKRYGRTVQAALQWLREYALAGKVERAYSHGIATYALADALSLTGIPVLRSPLEQAVQVIIDGQQPDGGFDYRYKQGARWDMSVSGWQFQALKAAYIAGATNPGLEQAQRKAISFMRRRAYGNPGFGYAKQGGTRPNLTGAGAVCLQLLGQWDSAEVKTAVDYIGRKRLPQYRHLLDHPEDWDKVAAKCMYGWYYDTQAVFFAQQMGGNREQWTKGWAPVFQKVLHRAQHDEGYWQVAGGHGMGTDLDGRILATCWAVLQLEVFYRTFLPSYDVDLQKSKTVATQPDAADDAFAPDLL